MNHQLLLVKVIGLCLLCLLIYSVFEGRAFWKSVFSDGVSGSLSRVMTAFNGLFALAWITYVVMQKSEIPNPAELAGIAAFVSSPYGLNLAARVATAAVSKPATSEHVTSETKGSGESSVESSKVSTPPSIATS